MRSNFMAALSLTTLLGCSAKQAKPETAAIPEPSASTTSSSASDADAGAAVKTLFVADKRVDCEGEGPQKCLQVRHTEAEPWTLFYSPIEGFTYEEGHSYELRVEEHAVAHPPADGSSLRYRLVELVSKH